MLALFLGMRSADVVCGVFARHLRTACEVLVSAHSLSPSSSVKADDMKNLSGMSLKSVFVPLTVAGASCRGAGCEDDASRDTQSPHENPGNHRFTSAHPGTLFNHETNDDLQKRSRSAQLGTL
jgi:hypothetical protein